MAKSTQRAEPVERAVMRALRKKFQSKLSWEDDEEYVRLEVDPLKYSDQQIFVKDWVLVNFLKKWKGLRLKVNREEATFAAWMAAEQQCARTNQRLTYETSVDLESTPLHYISVVQRKIARILGPLDFDAHIAPLCRFGNGATFDLKRGATYADKMCSNLTVTIGCIPYACRVLAHDQLWEVSLEDLTIVEANRMTTVPKSAKIDRMIACEPTLNGFIQQGVGRYLKHRLKRAGVDLKDQTINQELAFAALVDGLATIDLSSASDTMSHAIVRLLLPPDWVDLLEALRCPKSIYNGKQYVNSKFSSMGNAFTFELESLIFYALASVAVELNGDDSRKVSVFGDDIIVPASSYETVTQALRWAGFLINAEKSYTAPSRFYESCGKHYFDLEEVTPCYQKEICRRPQEYIRLYNRLMRCALRTGLLTEFRPALKIVIEHFVRDFDDKLKYRRGSHPVGARKYPVVFGPVVEGDRFFIDPFFKWPAGRDRIKLECLVRVLKDSEHYGDSQQKMFYGYKLRMPTYANSSKKGECIRQFGEAYMYRHVEIWYSGLFRDASLRDLDRTLPWGEETT